MSSTTSSTKTSSKSPRSSKAPRRSGTNNEKDVISRSNGAGTKTNRKTIDKEVDSKSPYSSTHNNRNRTVKRINSDKKENDTTKIMNPPTREIHVTNENEGLIRTKNKTSDQTKKIQSQQEEQEKTPKQLPTTAELTPRSKLKYGLSLDFGAPTDLPIESSTQDQPPPSSSSPTKSDNFETVKKMLEEKRELEKRISELKKNITNTIKTGELAELEGLTNLLEEFECTSMNNIELILRKNKSSSLSDDDGADDGFTANHRLSHHVAPVIKHSFSIEGMSRAEVKKEVNKSKSHHHGRSLEEAEEKIVSMRRPPALLEEPHEETFYELFYDLILVVVFIKLSYLKYDLTLSGVLSVFALFANFWSCWSLLNCYVTILHTEDVFHRFYYVTHILASFIMAVSIQNPEFDFFNYRYMAWYHSGASIICRLITLFMWGYAFTIDLVETRHEHSIFDYELSDVRKQIAVHFFTLFASIMIFATTMVIPFNYESSGSAGHHWPTAVLWILAVVVEQMGTTIASVVMKLPFPAHYAGARMQAWLMLCFGESVIALLIEPIFYDSVQVGSITAAFIMILCLCTAYFDIVDADEFLNLLIVRGETIKAIFYMNFQCVFSFSVFLVGVSLKTIIYVSNTLYLYEIISGCGLGQHHEAPHRKLSIISKANFTTSIYGYLFGSGIISKRSLSFFGYTPYHGDVSNNNEENRSRISFDYEEELHRRLGSSASDITYTINELDDLLFKSFILLCMSTTIVMMFSILIGYCMPIGLPTIQVHFSRIGAVIVSMVTMVIPFTLKSLATACFKEYEADDDQFESHASPEGISIMKALVITSLIIFGAFVVALGSLDPNREATYAKLEEEALYNQTKHHLEIQSHTPHATSSIASFGGQPVALSKSQPHNDDASITSSFDTIRPSSSFK